MCISGPDDFVFDPFCGCATALVAADRLQREWAGIDLSPLAIKLVNERIAGDRAATKEVEHNPVIGGSLFRVTALTEPSSRTDLGVCAAGIAGWEDFISTLSIV